MLYNKSNNKSNFRLHSLKKTNKQAFKQNQKKKNPKNFYALKIVCFFNRASVS